MSSDEQPLLWLPRELRPKELIRPNELRLPNELVHSERRAEAVRKRAAAFAAPFAAETVRMKSPPPEPRVDLALEKSGTSATRIEELLGESQRTEANSCSEE